MKKKLKLFIVMSLIMTMFVGCGNTEKTTALNEIGAVENVMTEKENVLDSIAESTETPTPEPTETPTVEPTETPAPEPTETPTVEPTETPAPEPTEIPTVEPTETPTHQHNYTEVIITEALCNTTGVKEYSCECGDSYTKEYVDTWNHKRDGNRVVGTEATCEEPGTTYEHCIHCGTWMYPEEGAPAKGHEPWDYWIYHHGTGTYRRGCNNCGKLLDETTEKPEGVEIRDFYPRPVD